MPPGLGLGTVLGVWAHPDDEAYLSSGLMARAAAEGSRVVCVTATRGEGGSTDPAEWPPETLGEVRAEELRRCLSLLGVNEHVFLDLPDVDWDTPLPDEGEELVRTIMRDVSPDTVLTFGPDGITGHEGHRSVSRWATDAFRREAPPGAALYHAVYSSDWSAAFLPHLLELGVFREGAEPPVVDQPDLDLVLEGALLSTKIAAVQEHRSQISGLAAVFGEDRWAQAMSRESFRKVMTAPPAGRDTP